MNARIFFAALLQSIPWYATIKNNHKTEASYISIENDYNQINKATGGKMNTTRAGLENQNKVMDGDEIIAQMEKSAEQTE